MASILLIVSGLLTFSQMLEANNFVTVDCQRAKIVAQYGTDTLLDCVVKTSLKNVEIISFNWKKNEEKVLSVMHREVKSLDPSYKTAVSSRDVSNMNVSLLITNTDLSHTGEYSCSVITNKGAGTTKVQLTVKSNYSKVTIESDPEKITPDKDFTLTCKANNGFPKGDIRWVVNDVAWMKNPEVVSEQNPSGLFDLTSKLSFGHDTQFSKFGCEVYNDKGVKEGYVTFEKPPMDQRTGSEQSGSSVTKIVAPVVVIGSLIVGLLVAILLCRRNNRRRARRLSEAPLMTEQPANTEESVQMV